MPGKESLVAETHNQSRDFGLVLDGIAGAWEKDAEEYSIFDPRMKWLELR